MRSRIIFLLIGLSGLFASFAHAADSMPVVAAATRQQSESIPHRGTLYRVRHQGNTTYLFGTIHVGKPAFFPLEAQVMQAFAEATKLVVELDIGNAGPFLSAVNKYGIYAAGDTIEKHLSRDSMVRLRQALQRLGIRFEQVARMKPWMVANFLIGVDLERNGFAQKQGTEFFLLALAKAQAKTVEELETADYQLSLFDGMTQAQQEQYLRENLAEIDDGKMLMKATRLMNAWGDADGGAFDEMLREAFDEKTASSEFILHMLLEKRNPEMAGKIETLLNNDKATFVAVGLLHLIGENGIPRLLQRRGYDVQKLY
ncbi:MAG: TraB/GumN family protein [Herminiimonas sp.]|nr:TraB/GumN family protein [Herminiimonas sp.]